MELTRTLNWSGEQMEDQWNTKREKIGSNDWCKETDFSNSHFVGIHKVNPKHNNRSNFTCGGMPLKYLAMDS